MKKWQLFTFLLFALLVPVGYLAIRYGLFTLSTGDTTLKINMVGIIAIIILMCVISVLIKYYIEAMKTKYSLIKQILMGVIKLILPLSLCLAIIVLIGNNIEQLKQALLVIIPSEFIAIIVNPFPKWCFDNNIEGIGNIFDKIVRGKEQR